MQEHIIKCNTINASRTCGMLLYTFSYIGRSPKVVFFSCMRCRGGLGASPCFSVRTSVPRAAAAARPPPPSELQNMLKRSKPFKINGLGPFWGTHLRSFVYTNLKKYARMQRGDRFDTCPFCTGAMYIGGPNNAQNSLK